MPITKQVVPGIYTFRGLGAGRVYLLEGDEGLIVVDAGLRSAPAKIIEQIEALGHRPEDVKNILVTHAHPDHVGGLPELHRISGAQVIASETEQSFVEGKEPVARPPRDSLRGVWRMVSIPPTLVPGTPVDRAVSDGDSLPGGLQVVATPGHAPGHVSFWEPERRVLFLGDVVFRLPLLGLRLPPAPFTVDMAEDKRSVGRVAELEPSVVCFGHGEPLVDGAAEALAAFRDRIARSRI